MDVHEEHRNLNSELADASGSVTRVLENYYRLAENKELSEEQHDKLLEMAAEIKTHTAALQSMMGEKTDEDKKSEKAKSDDSDSEDDEFLSGLAGDLPRKAKARKETAA